MVRTRLRLQNIPLVVPAEHLLRRLAAAQSRNSIAVRVLAHKCIPDCPNRSGGGNLSAVRDDSVNHTSVKARDGMSNARRSISSSSASSGMEYDEVFAARRPGSHRASDSIHRFRPAPSSGVRDPDSLAVPICSENVRPLPCIRPRVSSNTQPPVRCFADRRWSAAQECGWC